MVFSASGAAYGTAKVGTLCLLGVPGWERGVSLPAYANISVIYHLRLESRSCSPELAFPILAIHPSHSCLTVLILPILGHIESPVLAPSNPTSSCDPLSA